MTGLGRERERAIARLSFISMGLAQDNFSVDPEVKRARIVFLIME